MRTTRPAPKSSFNKKQPPAPPNYSSRKVQLRLLTMIMAFGATVWMMNEARKPKNWAWFTSLNQAAEQQEEQPRNEEPDTRMRDRPTGDSTPPGVIDLGSDAPATEIEFSPTSAEASGLESATYAAWEHALGGLSRPQRRLFSRIMLSGRGRAELLPENAELRKEVLGTLDERFNGYFRNAFQAVMEQQETLSDDEKAAWLVIIQKLETGWESELQPALMTISTGGQPSPEQQQLLERAQQVIDRVDVAAVTDNTIFRPEDEHAWFRLLERLQSASQSKLEQQEAAQVGFLELFEQPDVYRGKLVRVTGDLKLAKQVRPPNNALDIEEYYMFWLRPDGSNSPIAIYTLELPPDFPELEPAGTTLDSRATFTAYFFKRWIYPAGDGPRIAPVLLAKAASWSPEPVEQGPIAPATSTIILLVAGAALIGLAIALVVYVTARVKSSNRSPYNVAVQQAPERLAAMEQQPAPPTAGEKLERYITGDSSEKGNE